MSALENYHEDLTHTVIFIYPHDNLKFAVPKGSTLTFLKSAGASGRCPLVKVVSEKQEVHPHHRVPRQPAAVHTLPGPRLPIDLGLLVATKLRDAADISQTGIADQ